MLYTNLKHLENPQEHAQAIRENEQVIVTCGRMEYGSITVFRMMEELEKIYPHVRFYDMEFDNPASMVICSLPEIIGSSAIPFMVFYLDGKVVHTTSGKPTKEEMIRLIHWKFMNHTRKDSKVHTTNHTTY